MDTGKIPLFLSKISAKANMAQGNKRPQTPSAQGAGWEGVRGFIQRLDILWSYEALLLYRSCGKLETKVFLWPKQATYPPLSAFIIVCTKTPWVQRAPPGSPRWTEGEKQLEEWVPEKGWGAEQLCVPHSASTEIHSRKDWGENWPPNVLLVNKPQLIHHRPPLKCVKIHCISWTIQLDKTCGRANCSTPETSYRLIRTTAMLNPLYSLLCFFTSHIRFLIPHIHHVEWTPRAFRDEC